MKNAKMLRGVCPMKDLISFVRKYFQKGEEVEIPSPSYRVG